MGYTVHELAKLSGVSVRTLHYYEEQGLLHPLRRENGYRDYGPDEVRRLQQVLLYRRANMPVAAVRDILELPPIKQAAALEVQLDHLRGQRDQLDGLIATVERMVYEINHKNESEDRPHMSAKPPADIRNDAARFEAFKREALRENERIYGEELRQRYGNDAIDESNRQVESLTHDQWNEAAQQSEQIAQALAAIAASSNAEERILGEEGRALCDLHRAWLMHYWTPAMYTPAAHRSLAQMYVADERFAATYEAMAPNGARILCDAIET